MFPVSLNLLSTQPRGSITNQPEQKLVALSENRTPVRKCAHCSRIKCSHKRHEVILAGFGQVSRVPVTVHAQAFSRSERYSRVLLLLSNPANNVPCVGTSRGASDRLVAAVHQQKQMLLIGKCEHVLAHTHAIPPGGGRATWLIPAAMFLFFNPIASCDSQIQRRRRRRRIWRQTLDTNTSTGHTLRVCLCSCQSIPMFLNLWTWCLDLPPGSTGCIQVTAASGLTWETRGGQALRNECKRRRGQRSAAAGCCSQFGVWITFSCLRQIVNYFLHYLFAFYVSVNSICLRLSCQVRVTKFKARRNRQLPSSHRDSQYFIFTCPLL